MIGTALICAVKKVTGILIVVVFALTRSQIVSNWDRATTNELLKEFGFEV